MNKRIEELKKLEGEMERRLLGKPDETEENQGDASEDQGSKKDIDKENKGSQKTFEEDTSQETSSETPEDSAEKLKELDKRFRNYKASTDKTIFELRQEKKKLLSDLAKSLEEVSSLRDRLDSIESDDVAYPFTEEDEKLLGPEALDVFKRVLKETQKTAKEPIRQQEKKRTQDEIQRLKQESEEPTETPRDRFIADLTWYVPKWKDIIDTREFREFLKTKDDLGFTYEDKWRAAEQKFNVDPIVRIFKAFTEKPQVKQEDPFEEHLAPDTSPNGNTKVKSRNERKIYSQKEINDFYQKVQSGYYNKTRELQKEREKIEAEIDRQAEDLFYGRLK